jgi:mono/diheme cytochrome c family protein
LPPAGLFFFAYRAVDGGGANVGNGLRFTRLPRADLTGPGQWWEHYPARATGPNEQSCVACHASPFANGAGSIVANVVRDPLRAGNPAQFIQRQTPHLFAAGAVQRVAEEMTADLYRIRSGAGELALASGETVIVPMITKGVSFGVLAAIPGTRGLIFDISRVVGVGPDLIIRPFSWKGDDESVRGFNRDAAHGELGMQATEVVGHHLDGDFDGVVDELTVGDTTAMAVYNAAQPRPTTQLELARLGLIEPLPQAEVDAIARGEAGFAAIGCALCHQPQLLLDDPIFSEPSTSQFYRDDVAFPDGSNPRDDYLFAEAPITFDLTADQPDNQLHDSQGNLVYHLGALQRAASGQAIVALYGDLKRHEMGPDLAEPVDEILTGPSNWLTENLWGVGSTAPYLHDGRATTLAEAVSYHGGEAKKARDHFLALPDSDRDDIVRFLQNLVLFVVADSGG